MPNFVQMYRSTDLNAPAGPSSTTGTLLTVLDAVLVNGYTPAALTSITRSGTLATALLTVANTTLETGNWVTIGGCTGGDAAYYNGTFQVTVADSTHFSYTMTGTPGASAAGSPTYAKASLGWTRPFNAGNISTYLPQVVAGYPRFYLRIDDAANTSGLGKEALARGFETMSDVNTGTQQFPVGTGVCWRKSSDGNAKSWVIVGDGRTFYIVINSDSALNAGRGFYAFGGFESFKPGDSYNSLLNGWVGFNATTQGHAGTGLAYGNINATMTTTGGGYAARSLSQAGGAVVLANFVSMASAANTLGANVGTIVYPAQVDSGLWVQSPLMVETNSGIPRGRMSGVYSHCHTSLPMADGDRITNVAGLPGVTLVCVSITSSSTQGQVLIDITGPW